MAGVLILNGSPRAPRSHSREYARLFQKYCALSTEYAEITAGNHRELCGMLDGCSQVLLFFPLYADGIPVTLLNFLKTLEANPPAQKPGISVLVNCGFLEPEQSDVAVEMIRLFCREQGYPFRSVLRVGSGEAILNTPFRAFAAGKIKRLAAAVSGGRSETLKVTMPIPKGMFVKASAGYWKEYGKRNGVTPEQMAAMEIEP